MTYVGQEGKGGQSTQRWSIRRVLQMNPRCPYFIEFVWGVTALWTNSSISLIRSSLLYQSHKVGDLNIFHKTGIQNLAAVTRCMARDLLRSYFFNAKVAAKLLHMCIAQTNMKCCALCPSTCITNRPKIKENCVMSEFWIIINTNWKTNLRNFPEHRTKFACIIRGTFHNQ